MVLLSDILDEASRRMIGNMRVKKSEYIQLLYITMEDFSIKRLAKNVVVPKVFCHKLLEWKKVDFVCMLYQVEEC